MKISNFKSTAIPLILGIVVITMSVVSSCKKSSDDKKTLYDSLGGTSMVTDPVNPTMKIEQGRLNLRSVVDSTIFVIAADTAINGQFTVLLAEVTSGNLTGFSALSKNLTDFFCTATGAKNFTYSGKNMVAAHDPAQNSRMNGKADNADFDAFIADLVVGAQQNNVSNQLIGQIGALVETLRSDVVQN